MCWNASTFASSFVTHSTQAWARMVTWKGKCPYNTGWPRLARRYYDSDIGVKATRIIWIGRGWPGKGSPYNTGCPLLWLRYWGECHPYPMIFMSIVDSMYLRKHIHNVTLCHCRRIVLLPPYCFVTIAMFTLCNADCHSCLICPLCTMHNGNETHCNQSQLIQTITLCHERHIVSPPHCFAAAALCHCRRTVSQSALCIWKLE